MYGAPAPSSADNRYRTPHWTVLHQFPPSELEAKWRSFIDQAVYPSAYDTPEFFLEPYWESRHPFAVIAWAWPDIIGVLTGIHMHDHVISGLPSRPQICVRSDSNWSAPDILLKGLLEEAQSAHLIEVFTWHRTALPEFLENNFHKKQLVGDVVLDLEIGTEALFKQAHENRRRNIRAALKNGIEVSEIMTPSDLAGFWEVYLGWQQTQRKQINRRLDFAQIEKVYQLRRNHRIFLARYKGKPVAATSLRFCPKGLVEYAGNCSLDEFIHLRPNDLLIWKTIEWACQQGFRKYSLGASHPFLRKSGGHVEPIDCYRLDRTFLHRHERRTTCPIRREKYFMHSPRVCRTQCGISSRIDILKARPRRSSVPRGHPPTGETICYLQPVLDPWRSC